MVWGLFPVDSLPGDQNYFIFSKGTYKVGRKGCDVIINTDKGVSRIHAVIIVDSMTSIFDVRIKDCSKYGTFINWKMGSKTKVHDYPNKVTTVKHGDLISFGSGNATYRFCFVPLTFFVYSTKPFQVDRSLQEQISSIGACDSQNWRVECTHALVDESSPVKEDLIDVVVDKKPVILKKWVKVLAEKSISTELPGFVDCVPVMTFEGSPVKVVDPKARENSLAEYTFLLGPTHLYKFGDRLQSLLDVGGAKFLSINDFCSNSQASEDVANSGVVLVNPTGSTNQFSAYQHLRSVPRVTEVNLVSAVLSGHLDSSFVESPPNMAPSGASNSATATSTTSKPPINSQDIAYAYCTVDDPKTPQWLICNFCKKGMSSEITRFKQHLVHKAGNVGGCPNVPLDVQVRIQKLLSTTEAKKNEAARTKRIMEGEDEEECDVMTIEGNGEGDEEDANPSTTPTPSPTLTPSATPSSGIAATTSKKKRKAASNVRGSMDLFTKKTNITYQTTLDYTNPIKKKLKEEAWEWYAKWSYSAGLPFNAVNDPNFPKFIHAVGEYGRAMPPPSYHIVRVTMLKKVLSQTKEFVESFRPKWKEYGCSIMCDFWTDGKGRCLINFLVNCPQGTVFLKSIDASEHVKDRHLIVDMINGVIEDVGIENIVQFITNNGSNYKFAGEILMATHETMYWTPCAAHCINLMLQDVGNDIDRIKDVLVEANKVVVYIYNHGRVLNMMRKLSRRELHRSCVTKFATSFYTLETMYKNRHHVQTLFVSSNWTRSAFAKTTKGKRAQSIVSRTTFWNNVQLACQVMAPLVDVIRMMDREAQPCMGYMYDVMEKAKLKIEKNLVGGDARMITKVCEIVDKRWKEQLDHSLHSVGCYLNPAIFYKHVRTDSHMKSVKRRFYMALDRMVRNIVENDKIRIQLEEYEVASGDFGTGAAIRLREQVAPSKWWNMHGLGTPELQNFAMRVLNLTCIASPSERNWSAFENLHTKKRNCLLQETLNKLVYIQYNMKLERRFKDTKNASKTWDPIVLREVEENDDWIIPTDEELTDYVFQGDRHVGPSTRSRGAHDHVDGGGGGDADVDSDNDSEYEELEPGDD